MGFCAQTSCGNKYAEFTALKKMNKQGVYSPEQIEGVVEKQWKKHSGEEDTFVNKDTCQIMVEGSVNALGKQGDGQKFDEALFEKAYKKLNKWGSKDKIVKQMVVGMTTYMVQQKKA